MYSFLQLDSDPPPAQRVIGADRIREVIDWLAGECVSEVMEFVGEGPQAWGDAVADRPPDHALLARGIRLRSLYPESAAHIPQTLEYARWLTAEGGEIRTTAAGPPARMAIYDRSIALVAVYPARGGTDALLLSGADAVSVLAAHFDQAWDAATDLDALRWQDGEGATGRAHEIQRLLAAGETDEAVARKLGVSVRTTRRLMGPQP
jgi:hypothetical protein